MRQRPRGCQRPAPWRRLFDNSLGWSKLFERGFEVVTMVGDHLSMIREHHPALAREMDEVLKRDRPFVRRNGHGHGLASG
ncbi:MAG TPA: hypothetical protein VF384_17115 [Planctomycetota bacterium]